MKQRSEPARTVQIAAKLYEMRDGAKLVLGDRYGEEMRRLRVVIEAVQKRHGISSIAAGTKICSLAPVVSDGLEVICIMAAAVEMIEPSEAGQENPYA